MMVFFFIGLHIALTITRRHIRRIVRRHGLRIILPDGLSKGFYDACGVLYWKGKGVRRARGFHSEPESDSRHRPAGARAEVADLIDRELARARAQGAFQFDGGDCPSPVSWIAQMISAVPALSQPGGQHNGFIAGEVDVENFLRLGRILEPGTIPLEEAVLLAQKPFDYFLWFLRGGCHKQKANLLFAQVWQRNSSSGIEEKTLAETTMVSTRRRFKQRQRAGSDGDCSAASSKGRERGQAGWRRQTR